MTLLDKWRTLAYDTNKSKIELNKFWNDFFEKESIQSSSHPLHNGYK